MANRKGMGVHMVSVDVMADKEEEHNRWYHEEHMGERMAMPGVLNSARYVAVSGGPKYLTCYELEAPEVFNNKEHAWGRENPTEWTKRMHPARVSTRVFGMLCQQIFPAEVSLAVAQSDMAQVLQIERVDVPAEAEDEFAEWYDTTLVPSYEKVPGCIRVRRYETATWALRGEPKYAMIYEFENENVPQSPEWAAARDAHTLSAQILPQMKHDPGSPGIYKKIFQLPGP